MHLGIFDAGRELPVVIPSRETAFQDLWRWAGGDAHMLLLLPKVSRVVHQMIVVARWQSHRAGVEKEFASCEGAAKFP